MIELYEGRLGGGKSYSATVRMVDHIRRGGIVCTNVELIWPKVKTYIAQRFGLIAEDSQFISLADDEIGLFHRFTPSGTVELPVLVVIDEAHLTFNARDFAQTDKLYRETLTFLTQSRKVNTDVIFIAQSVLNMDKQFMRLVQFIWRFRDLAKWKIPGLGIQYPLKQILAVQFDYDGKTVLQRSFVRKDPRIFGLYNTNSLIRAFPRLEMVASKKTLQKSTRDRTKQMKILIPIGVIVGCICMFLLYRQVTNFGKKRSPDVTITSEAAHSVNSTATPKHSEKTEQNINTGAYDIYAESFQGWNSATKALKTFESGWYQVGEMSHRGYVTAISDRRVKLAQPDGRTGWVVASKDYIPPSNSPTPTPTPIEKKEVIVANSQPPIAAAIATPIPTPFPLAKVR
jgi:hypothetical protein